MESIDLEKRIAKLETCVECDVQLDALKKKLHTLEQEPTIKTVLDFVGQHTALFKDDSLGSDSDELHQKIDLVIAQEDVIQDVETQLDLVSKITIPSIATSQLLIEHLPEVTELWKMVEEQERQIAILTRRTIKVIDEWYKQGIRPTNRAMIDADDTMRKLAQHARTRKAESDD